MKATVNKIAFSVIALAALACLMWLVWPRPAAVRPVATLQVDGKIIRVISLSAAPDEIFTVTTPSGGEMTFEVRDHAVAFTASSCPDKICVHNGFLSREGQTAICLPNRAALTLSAD